MERLDKDGYIAMALSSLGISCNEKTIDLILRLSRDADIEIGTLSLMRVRKYQEETENAFK